MRKDRYLEQTGQCISYLRRVVGRLGLDDDEAADVVSKCYETLIGNKTYVSIVPSKLKGFLYASVRAAGRNYQKTERHRKMVVSRLPDTEEMPHAIDLEEHIYVDNIPEHECPFCFKANLNEYGACHMCHTIVPSHIRTPRNTITMSRESLACQFDFNTHLDVQRAITQLTPWEQQVVTAVLMGNETLEGFGMLNEKNKVYMWRTLVIAKAKLRGYLEEYSPRKLSKRTPEEWRRALQHVEKTVEL